MKIVVMWKKGCVRRLGTWKARRVRVRAAPIMATMVRCSTSVVIIPKVMKSTCRHDSVERVSAYAIW